MARHQLIRASSLATIAGCRGGCGGVKKLPVTIYGESAAAIFISRRFESMKAGEKLNLYNCREDYNDGLNDKDQAINQIFRGHLCRLHTPSPRSSSRRATMELEHRQVGLQFLHDAVKSTPLIAYFSQSDNPPLYVWFFHGTLGSLLCAWQTGYHRTLQWAWGKEL
uniref:Uncharacterized protein n=1 Tax=Nicotiana tabacum TaxID=4097 RepID=A0A1S4BK70_TOBAC|nr:PREDICTED: uncharacterized protein LOC107809237 [Nicotiana tabacum]